MQRRNFFKKSCIAGACFCGFGAMNADANETSSSVPDSNMQLKQDWLASLLSNLSNKVDAEVVRDIVKKSARFHYDNLNMDVPLADYVGNLKKFNSYIEKEWGWKINYDETTKVLIADENKDHCVCPILKCSKEEDTSAICYCSEGFAEKMFSVVTGKTVKAEVISSIRKGDKTCMYKVELA